MKMIMAISACVGLLTQSAAFAHEGQNHLKAHKEDAQMEKLHKMMPMYSQAQAKISEALEKGDSATVESETGKILATTPDLKKSKPHKNLKEVKTMRKIASAFERDIKNTAVLVKKRDFTGAKGAFAKAQKRCNECHVKFRD